MPQQTRPPKNLEQLIDQLDALARDKDPVSLGALMQILGRRSFGPLILVAGLITLAPVIGDIPGVPSLIGLFMILTLGQILFQREHLWLPQWLRRRSVASGKVQKSLHWMRRPARFIDRLLRPRLHLFTEGIALYFIAAICILIAAATPLMEVVPFSANVAGAVLTTFGLALIAGDGLFALIALILTLVTAGFMLFNLM